ncbi:MAG: hypothetical protein E7084_04520 [Bacteroidales bacterium]|nr:hypothetical protein [Bacteroidales bacterium]
MFNKKLIARIFGWGTSFVVATALLSGCDKSYDLDQLGGDITLFENGVTAPIGNTDKFYLKDFIEENDLLQTDSVTGNYVIRYSGESATSLSLPSFNIDGYSESFPPVHLDFFESVKNNEQLSGIIDLLEMVGYYHGDEIPEITNPLTGEREHLIVPSVHAEIEHDVEVFEIDVPVPEELIDVKNISLGDGAIIEMTFHAEGFPVTLDSVSFDFIVHPPLQMHIERMDETILFDPSHMTYEIKHKLPCVNGKLDDKVTFRLVELHFEEPLTRNENGELAIFAEFEYEGSIDINHEFDLTGWTPVMDMNVGFSLGASTVEEVEACVQAQVDPIALSQEIEGLPEILTRPENCLDLRYLTLQLDVNNGTPAALETQLKLQSTFHDGSMTEEIGTENPLRIAPNALQKIIISNEEKYKDEPGYIPNLHKLMYRIPKMLSLEAVPSIPPTDVKIDLRKEFNVAINYALSVPIIFGGDLALHLSGDFGDLGADIAALSENAAKVGLSGNIENTLPLNVNLDIEPVDADGNVLRGVTIEGIPMTVKANDVTPLKIVVSAEAGNDLDKLYTLRYVLSGNAGGESNSLRPDQYLQFSDIKLSLPEGITVMVK